MLATAGPHLILRLTNSVGARKILVYLIVQVFAVSDHKESPITRKLAQNLLREEDHRIALAAALRVPEDAKLPLILSNLLSRRDRPVHSQVLMILRNQLD